LPIIIRNAVNGPMPEDYDLVATIEDPNRVCEINLIRLSSSQLKRLAPAMQKEFPALIHLGFGLDVDDSRPAPALPDGFIAPRLQSLKLDSIPFPTLPKLLLSATDLSRLTLRNIPHSGYISPEALVTGLATLANLNSLTIEFKSPLSRPDPGSRPPPPPTRIVLPTLTRFEFQGISDYLEDLVSRVDAPLLDSIWVTFFHQLLFHIPQLKRFMRTTRIEALHEAHVDFGYYGVRVGSLPPTRIFDEKSKLSISCRELDWQLSSLEQVLIPFFPSVYTVEYLYIHGPRYMPLQWRDDIDIMQWLEIFHPFTAVKNLYVCRELVQCIASALQGVRNLLPALESLFLEELEPSGPVQEAIGDFVAAQQLLGQPVAISQWNRT